MGMSVRAQKIDLFLSVSVADIKMNVGPIWEILQKCNRLQRSKPLIDEVYLGCTQREATVDLQAVQSKADLFKQSKTTLEAKLLGAVT